MIGEVLLEAKKVATGFFFVLCPFFGHFLMDGGARMRGGIGHARVR